MKSSANEGNSGKSVSWRPVAFLFFLFFSTFAPARVRGQQQPFTLEQVVELLKGRVSEGRILDLIRADCIAFSATAEANTRLEAAGASPDFLQSLKAICVVLPEAQRQPHKSRFGQGWGLALYVSNMVATGCCDHAEMRPITRLADNSPNPTLVHPDFATGELPIIYSIGVGFRPRKGGIQLGVEYYLLSDAAAGGASLGWQPFLPLGNSGIRLQPSFAARVDGWDIPIGRVGFFEDDGYFQDQTGVRLPSDSKVFARGVLVGVELTGGIAFNVSPRSAIHAEFGYRLLRGVGVWAFRIERGGQVVELPVEGVPFAPKEFSPRGLLARVSFSL
jgi:hypothetical protein